MSGMMQWCGDVGTGAGVTQDDEGREVPVVTMHFIRKDLDVEFDPENDEHCHSFALGVRAARQLVADLQECIDSAVEGPN